MRQTVCVAAEEISCYVKQIFISDCLWIYNAEVHNQKINVETEVVDIDGYKIKDSKPKRCILI
jgi:hypothetical protein